MFPLAQTFNHEIAKLHPKFSASPKKKQILLVEDDAWTESLFSRILKSIDPSMELTRVSTTEDAISKLSGFENENVSPVYDLLIVDIFLANLGNGLDVFNYCKNRGISVPVVFTSAIDTKEYLQMFSRKSFCPPFLPKPFKVDDARNLFRSRLSNRI